MWEVVSSDGVIVGDSSSRCGVCVEEFAHTMGTNILNEYCRNTK